jgi:prepilin-type N-terminal cleavage/methylation domain-containing protein
MSTVARGSEAGFTLIEVLIALAVGVIALSALPTTLRITGNATLLARDGTIALGFAQAKLEELIGDPSRRVAGEDVVTVPGTASTFARSWNVTPVSGPGSALSLSTTVTWDNERHEIAMETSIWMP